MGRQNPRLEVERASKASLAPEARSYYDSARNALVTHWMVIKTRHVTEALDQL